LASAALADRGVDSLLVGRNPSIDYSGSIRAWAAERLFDGGASAAGVLGPVAAFGLDALSDGSDQAGIRRTS
jgi:hypothetical protein